MTLFLDPLERANELAMDGQFEEALRTIDDALEVDPAVGPFHAMRSAILAATGRLDDASEAADRALELDGDDYLVLWAAAEIALARNEPEKAIAVATHAQELFPGDDEPILLEARALVALGPWDEVIARADYVLAGDGENETAAILRGLAIEAKKQDNELLTPAQWEDLARRFPLNPFARAAHGSGLLIRRDYEGAADAYRQALTLEPGYEWAKQGLLVSLKTRYPGYGLLLRFFFWLQTLTPQGRNRVAIGGVIGFSVLRRVAEANPTLRLVIVPLLVAYALFVLATWLADPLLNLALMRHPEARSLLSEDDRQSGAMVGGVLLIALVLAAFGWLNGSRHLLLAGLGFAAASLPIAGAYSCEVLRYRKRLLSVAGAVAVLAAAAAVVPSSIATYLLGAGLIAAIGSTWLARSWSERIA